MEEMKQNQTKNRKEKMRSLKVQLKKTYRGEEEY